MKQNKNNTNNNSQKKLPTKETKRKMLSLVGLCILFMLVYFAAAAIPVPWISFFVTALYMLSLAVLAIVYVCYNYGFTRKNVTVDKLPDDWSVETKYLFVMKGEERAKKSKWMLFIIFPLIVTFIADVLYLYIWTGNLENFFKNLF